MEIAGKEKGMREGRRDGGAEAYPAYDSIICSEMCLAGLAAEYPVGIEVCVVDEAHGESL